MRKSFFGATEPGSTVQNREHAIAPGGPGPGGPGKPGGPGPGGPGTPGGPGPGGPGTPGGPHKT
ncbi:MAG: hypothetical protein QOG23_2466 [Blastocatellia bacterium]|jgi:hypothetical protein|nr:hypothetical protein [Blastocatellia bacterium]